MQDIQTIGILGAGQMGKGIAQVAAQAAFQVILADQTLEQAFQAKNGITQQLKRLVEKQKLSEKEMLTTLELITPAQGVQSLANTDCVIEAVTEQPEIKFQIFRELDRVCKSDTLLVSNTSSISLTTIAAQTKRAPQVMGMHFMNPVPLMKLVEGIRALQTSDSTFQSIKAMTERLQKTFIEVKDQPGFVVNRILLPMINEAIFVLQEGIADPRDIDSAMTLGTNQPMGPLTLADFIGLDTCLAILNVLHQGLGDPKYRPSPLLKQYVAAGWLGKKVKRGFFEYE